MYSAFCLVSVNMIINYLTMYYVYIVSGFLFLYIVDHKVSLGISKVNEGCQFVGLSYISALGLSLNVSSQCFFLLSSVHGNMLKSLLWQSLMY